MTLDLFIPEPETQDSPNRIALFPYQSECLAGVREKLASHRSTVAQLATGLGKTTVAAELIRTWPGRCLFLAHREELIDQAADRIAQFVGVRPEIEKAENRAGIFGNRPVVASVQSLWRRLHKFKPDAFSLIVVDECHHSVARTWRAPLDHFSGAKVLGLSATTDRADGVPLKEVFDSVAFDYPLPDAIRDGWLAPLLIKQVLLESLDFDRVRSDGNDFASGDLEMLLAEEKNLHGVAAPTVELAGDRQAIIYTEGVANAHRLAEVIDRYAGKGSARAIDGSQQMTKSGERKDIVAAFKRGDFQFLTNCEVCTEGFDAPNVSCIVMGRPTKSRALYTQMVGRGVRGGPKRPIPGKTDCLVLDFKANSSRHELVSALDVLEGSGDSAEVIRAAKKILEKSKRAMTADEAMTRGREKVERLAKLHDANRKKREKVTAEAQYRTQDADAHVEAPELADDPASAHLPTRQMWRELERLMGADNVERWRHQKASITRKEVGFRIGELRKAERQGLRTYKQLSVLRRAEIPADVRSSVKREQASRIIDWLKVNDWQRPPADVLARLLGGAA